MPNALVIFARHCTSRTTGNVRNKSYNNGRTHQSIPLFPATFPDRPMSDHFALVPRSFSDRFFAAITTFYACDGSSWPPPTSWWQPDCHGRGLEESVLFRYLHAAEVPYRSYSMFEYVVTRGERGGQCDFGKDAYMTACSLLGIANVLSPQVSRWVLCRATLCTFYCIVYNLRKIWVSQLKLCFQTYRQCKLPLASIFARNTSHQPTHVSVATA